MTPTTDIGEFFTLNGTEVSKFLRYRTGEHGERLRDMVSDAIVKLIDSSTLQTYSDSSGSFDAYVCTRLCWNLGAPADCTYTTNQTGIDLIEFNLQVRDLRNYIYREGGSITNELLESLDQRLCGDWTWSNSYVNQKYNRMIRRFKEL